MNEQYFDELLNLLQIEYDYDREQHEQMLLRSSLNERRTLGVTWYPLQISTVELGRGDYLSLTVQRSNGLEEHHRFRFGMPVSLFSNYDPTADRINGTIAFVNRESMRIAFRVDELPDWTRRGKLGVDLLFDENSYREMINALKVAKELLLNLKEGKFIRQLIGQDSFNFEPLKIENAEDPLLNKSQQLAIQNMISDHSLSIVHGPPGTGKTTTLIHGIQALIHQQGSQLLVVAPSNTAVDLLTERLDQVGVSVVRIGNPVKVSPHLQSLTLDGRMDMHSGNKEIKTLEKQMRAYTDMAHKYKRNFGKAERDQRKALFAEAQKIRKEVEKLQNYLTEDVLNKAQVITATLVGSNHAVIKDRKYAAVIVDEAAQALEPAVWISIMKSDKLVLAGDHLQLPPTVKSSKTVTSGLYHTLFEKLIELYPEASTMLDVQYRMHEQIMHHSSKMLYAGLLKADHKVADWKLLDDHLPILFIDTAGGGYEESEVDGGIRNVDEAGFLVKYLQHFIVQIQNIYSEGQFPSIGIIAPYRKQVGYLKEIIPQNEVLKNYLHHIQINTIDSFQGQERDVVYIGLTRSNMDQNIGFLSDVRRMNVAMTRAKKKLIIIGDSATIGQHPFYAELLNHVDALDAHQSIWEFDFQ